MTQAIVLWWHRNVLRHKQTPELNGVREPGVWCDCRARGYVGTYRRWFPSDGGHGR